MKRIFYVTAMGISICLTTSAMRGEERTQERPEERPEERAQERRKEINNREQAPGDASGGLFPC